MQTNFSLRQLQNPEIAQADEILRRCVHCGFCTATCPTYVLRGDERDSPRGRIYLMKEMYEEEQITQPLVTHIDRCLSCLSCMTTCPSGVDYMHLVDMTRVKIEENVKRPWRQRIKRWFLSKTMPYPSRFRFLLWAGWLIRPLKPVAQALGFRGIVNALDMVPEKLPPLTLPAQENIVSAPAAPLRRVAVLQGCVQDLLQSSINQAACRLLERHRIEVVPITDQACCGALDHHLGKEEQALQLARHNIDAWSAEMRKKPLDAILVTASGCGTMVKDYGALLSRDRGYADRAAAISSITYDISEFLADFGLIAPAIWSNLKIAYQSPCSLQHGQGIDREPKTLLREAGFRLVDLPEGHLCCGSAGTYSLLQPEFSTELRDRKLNHIKNLSPDIVATGNIGCLCQLKGGSSAPVVHTVELLDWATGGPCPASIKELEGEAKPVRELIGTEPA
ncbi:glycolate oxidase subunit GlcF [Methyloligella sp. 2.7D]|uniref:glycolate oxidase subunit GlcF n=1 Tax=unclassified Methyloligella TaxID=2625955 RepID=UPI00157DDD72|nr:glycolate oxidase subunit GlcF [Methyloligella sp. GL2]QKP78371.1 glycolate oxidase subunit GlcF [Methyloligella sp. GL2]